MNKKLIKMIALFLLLIPFRLPIAVLFIKALDIVAQMEGTSLPYDVLLGNIMVTKIIYNIGISSFLVYNLEMLSRELMERRAQEHNKDVILYYWTVILIILLVCYAIFDMHSTYNLFESIHIVN